MSIQGNAPSQRQLRVGEEVRRILAASFARGEGPDATIIDAPITVTEVCPSPDLRHAKVYVMPLGGRKMDDIITSLNEGAKFFQKRVARGLTTKFIPKLRFYIDESFDEASHISNLLNRPDVARDIEQPDEAVSE